MLKKHHREPILIRFATFPIVYCFKFYFKVHFQIWVFLGEYSAMILMSSLGTILFLGGWLPPFDLYIFNIVPNFIWFFLKVGLLLFVFLWVRATLPRYRYDQLMSLGWKLFLPLSLLWIIITSSILFFSNYVKF